jgi:hypothetical protein
MSIFDLHIYFGLQLNSFRCLQENGSGKSSLWLLVEVRIKSDFHNNGFARQDDLFRQPGSGTTA